MRLSITIIIGRGCNMKNIKLDKSQVNKKHLLNINKDIKSHKRITEYLKNNKLK